MELSFFEWVGLLFSEYWDLFLKGAGNTLLLAVIGTIIGFGIGLLVGVIRIVPLTKKDRWYKKVFLRIAQGILVAYVEVFRATPMIVQAALIYYGTAFFGLDMPVMTAALVTISINTGAYMAEIVRGGIISVDPGQTEGAQSLGMTHWQTMTSVVLPQAIRNIMPAIGNEFVINIKDSAVLSIISVPELLFQTKSAAGTYFQFFPAYFIACIIYFIMTFAITRILMALEKKIDGPANYVIKEALQKRSL